MQKSSFESSLSPQQSIVSGCSSCIAKTCTISLHLPKCVAFPLNGELRYKNSNMHVYKPIVFNFGNQIVAHLDLIYLYNKPRAIQLCFPIGVCFDSPPIGSLVFLYFPSKFVVRACLCKPSVILPVFALSLEYE